MNRLALRLFLVAFLALGALAAHAGSKSKIDRPQIPVRVHYSGNFEGELEPCG